MQQRHTVGQVTPLQDSVFNYTDYMPERFLHYYQQITHVLAFQPRRMLEIGPGDHTVTDFLRRKGVEVETYDNDPKLDPTYLGDIRKELVTRGPYDLVLASEVFEHMNVKWLPQVLRNIRRVLAPGGILLVSLPYSTLRLFPPRRNYGRIVSCEGRLHTHIPLYVLHTLLLRRSVLPTYPDDKFDVHHWDLGILPTTRRAVRKIFTQQFSLVLEKAYVNTNCVFFALQPLP